jgi:bacillithiol biosynthesis deacetylase BshB1
MNIIVAGPHPDDQELGMGGTIARLVAEGHRVLLLDLTDGEPTPFGDRATRAREAAEAARILGAERTTLDLPNRTLVHSVEARHRVAAVIRGFRPEVMFVPYFEDAHPDHVAGTRIVEDARFDAKLTKTDLPGDPWHARWLFHYYATHLRIVPQPSFLVDTTGFAARKREAVLAYRSQFVVNERNRRVVEWLDAAGTYFGSRIGTETAEPFFAREPIGLAGLAGLVG